MKKNIAFIALLCAVLLLTACGKSEPAAAPATEAPTATAEAPTEAPTEEPNVQLVNPVAEVTADEMIAQTGVEIFAHPAGENPRYWVINGEHKLAQVTFDMDGKQYTYRAVAAEMDAITLSGIYGVFMETDGAAVTVADVQGTLLAEGKAAVLYWADEGVTYALTCTDCDNPTVLNQVVVELFKPAADTDMGYAEMPDEYPDMVGSYADENYDDILLAATENDREFEATVGIYRLSTFEGTGLLTPLGMDLTLTDPNGGTLYATLTPNEDGTYTLEITDSAWELLETGTVFAGFTKNSVG